MRQLTLLAIILSLPLIASSAFAQAPAPYATMGAPSNPKVQARWNRYYDTAEVTAFLHELITAHPTRAKLQSLGKSYGGREMWVLTIANFESGDEQSKPAFWIDAGIHANEIQGVEVTLYTAWYLLESYSTNPFIRRLVDERAFYILPMLSPDSRDVHMHEAATTHSPRSGQRPVDDDRDGLVDEDGPDDLDGDGHIVSMRIADPHGKWKPDPKHPQLMVRVGPDEVGSYTLLGQEGIDNDGDEIVNEDGDGYYDPNRGWGWSWQPEYVQNGAHNYPFSILENRMAADFIAAHPNIAGAQSYHNAGGMILRGPGVRGEQFDGSDTAVYLEIAKKGELVLPGYRSMNVAEDLYEVFGGEVDWLHMMQGIFAFTNELFTPFNFFRRSSEAGFFGRDEDQYEFNKYLLFGDGLVEWREVEHPTYGKVEVGGFKKTWVRQPPSFLLEEECHRNMAFTLYHADQMPRVSVASIETKPLAGGLTEVTATIANDRLIPTHSAADVRRTITRPDLISIKSEGLTVIAGLISDDRFFRSPQEQKRQPGDLEVSTIPGMGVVYVRWIVQGGGPYTVTVRSPKGGVAELTGP